MSRTLTNMISQLQMSNTCWLRRLKRETSESSGRPCVFGYTPDGEYIIVVYERIDDDTILPVTAYEVPDPNL